MKIYNTLSRKKEVFKPLHEPKIGIYLCGPTVYDYAHLGHGRAAVSFDVIRKYFIYKGYDVTFVSNYTDIDDKLIQRSGIMKITVAELAEKIIPEYVQDYGALGIMPPDVAPKATEHVAQMITLIDILSKKGAAYVLDDGVYFDVKKFLHYGKLSKQNLEELKSGLRVEVNEQKRHPQDFVLWKFSKPGEPAWKSPWGKGRPGWHIECSAMSREYLGDTLDIHAGGADLIFPHHECEIAQSEMAYGKPFSRYWLHNGFIQINQEKMSKSLGNFFTLRDIFKKYAPQAVRYLFLQTHYRSPIEFSDALLRQSANSLARIHDFMRRLRNYADENSEMDKSRPAPANLGEFLEQIQEKFERAMEDDFETAQALAACFDLIKDANRHIDEKTLTREDKEKILNLLKQFDSILGIFEEDQSSPDPEIMALIQKREKARQAKDWAASDRIRDELLKKGIQLEDNPDGTIWKKLNPGS